MSLLLLYYPAIDANLSDKKVLHAPMILYCIYFDCHSLNYYVVGYNCIAFHHTT